MYGRISENGNTWLRTGEIYLDGVSPPTIEWANYRTLGTGDCSLPNEKSTVIVKSRRRGGVLNQNGRTGKHKCHFCRHSKKECRKGPNEEKCERCRASGRDCGAQILPKNDSHPQKNSSKKRIIQRVDALLQSNVSEEAILKALNSIPRSISDESIPSMRQSRSEPSRPPEETPSDLDEFSDWDITFIHGA